MIVCREDGQGLVTVAAGGIGEDCRVTVAAGGIGEDCRRRAPRGEQRALEDV